MKISQGQGVNKFTGKKDPRKKTKVDKDSCIGGFKEVPDHRGAL